MPTAKTFVALLVCMLLLATSASAQQQRLFEIPLATDSVTAAELVESGDYKPFDSSLSAGSEKWFLIKFENPESFVLSGSLAIKARIEGFDVAGNPNPAIKSEFLVMANRAELLLPYPSEGALILHIENVGELASRIRIDTIQELRYVATRGYVTNGVFLGAIFLMALLNLGLSAFMGSADAGRLGITQLFWLLAIISIWRMGSAVGSDEWLAQFDQMDAYFFGLAITSSLWFCYRFLQQPLHNHWCLTSLRFAGYASVGHLLWLFLIDSSVISSVRLMLICGPIAVLGCMIATLKGDLASRYLIAGAAMTTVPFLFVVIGITSDSALTLSGMLASVLVTLAILQRLAEQQRLLTQQAVQVSDRERFLATMSHEIRTPLNGIIGFIELIRQDRLSGELKEYFGHIDRSSRMLLSIVNDVLDYSKLQAGAVKLDLGPVSVGSLVEQVFSVVQSDARERNVALRYEPAPGHDFTVVADFYRCSQILVNLCSNAIKFSEGGSVVVSVRQVDGHIEISVCDDGIGIEPETLNRLFDPFQQARAEISRQYGGTGLGLAIARQLSELHQGSLHAESSPGKGSTFTLSLPAMRAENVAEPESGDSVIAADVETEGLRVLLVEDNDVNRLLAIKLLQSAGCQVDEAESGEEAIAKASENDYDIILMDMQLPKLDGIGATRNIRSWDRDTHIIALTANDSPEDRRDAIAAGMNDYISKPFKRDDLMQILRRAQQGTPSEL